MICECIDKINEQLKERNTEISTAFSFSDDMSKMDGVILVATHKIDRSKRGKPILANANFCPFCGRDLRARWKS